MPYMNEKVENGIAAFIAHAGDIVGGSGFADNARCNEYVRRELSFFLFLIMDVQELTLLASLAYRCFNLDMMCSRLVPISSLFQEM